MPVVENVVNNNIPKVLIGVLAPDYMPLGFITSLFGLYRGNGTDFVTKMMFTQSTILSHGRDTLANLAIDGNFTHLLFIDSDMTFPTNALTKLLARDKDIVTGLCFARKLEHTPCIYKAVNYKDPDPNVPRTVMETDINRDFFEIKACGMAFCLIKVPVLKDIKERCGGTMYGYLGTYGEDISFCIRAQELGYKLYCDTTFPIGHIGTKEYGVDDWKRS